MKKLLGIIVLGLMFISIDLSNPTTVKAASFEELEKKLREKRRNRGFFKKQWDKLNLNPVTYFEKRKECGVFKSLRIAFNRIKKPWWKLKFFMARSFVYFV